MTTWRRFAQGAGNAGLAAWFAGLNAFAVLCAATSVAAADNTVAVAVPVPAVAIYPGQQIGEEQIVDKKFAPSITRADVHQTRRTVVGKVARKVLLPGRPIPNIALKDVEPVSAGQPVTVVFSSEGIEILGRGTALQPGKLGDVISVRNIDSGVVIRASIESEGTVRVGAN